MNIDVKSVYATKSNLCYQGFEAYPTVKLTQDEKRMNKYLSL